MYFFFLRHWELVLKAEAAAPGGSRWSVAGAEGGPGQCAGRRAGGRLCQQRLVLAQGEQGARGTLPATAPLPAKGTLHPDNPRRCIRCPASPLASETPSLG